MIQYLYLGRVAYDEALRLQEELVDLRQQGRIDNVLLLLEHPPVLTLGRHANRANVLASDELLAAAASPCTTSTAAATSPTTAPASSSATPSSICAACAIPPAAAWARSISFARWKRR